VFLGIWLDNTVKKVKEKIQYGKKKGLKVKNSKNIKIKG